MPRQNRILYAIDRETGMIWSQVGRVFAIPILDFAGMKPENNWQMNYNLEKVPIEQLYGTYPNLIHTRKIPISAKNFHRAFWGMKPIKTKEGN